MAEHLVVVAPRTLRQLLRRPVLAWTRRRREPPVGRVRAHDRVFVKLSGGFVVASGTVARVREARKGGRYTLNLRLRGLKRLPVPFPVVKRDRRSWVVCAEAVDVSQQRLLAVGSPTLADLLRLVRTTQRRLPSRRRVSSLLAALAREPGSPASVLLWLALLSAAHDAEGVPETLREYFRKPARHVIPFAVFS